MRQVGAGHGDDLVTVAWPGQPSEPVTLATFARQLHERAAELAADFDARNGNSRTSGAVRMVKIYRWLHVLLRWL